MLLVVCEGGLEAQVLNDLRADRRLPSLRVEVVELGQDPSAVVRKAKSRRKEISPRKDEVETWVAFDRDVHQHWPAAVHDAQQVGFSLAISNPCIELWGILLYEDQRGHIERDQAQSRLKQLHADYDHKDSPYLVFEKVRHRLADAHERAEALLVEARRDDRLEYERNPTTHFHLLVARIQDVARDEKR